MVPLRACQLAATITAKSIQTPIAASAAANLTFRTPFLIPNDSAGETVIHEYKPTNSFGKHLYHAIYLKKIPRTATKTSVKP